MGSRRVPDVVLEAIYRFHECSVRSQLEETKLMNLGSSLVYNAVSTNRILAVVYTFICVLY